MAFMVTPHMLKAEKTPYLNRRHVLLPYYYLRSRWPITSGMVFRQHSTTSRFYIFQYFLIMYSATRFFSRALISFSSNQSKNIRHCATATQLGTVDFETVKKGLEKKSLTYIDVRNQSELQNEGSIVGSVNIPLPEVVDAFAMKPQDFHEKYGISLPEKNADNIVLGCLYAIRSNKAGLYLQTIGYNAIRIYSGGFNEWKALGGPILKSSGVAPELNIHHLLSRGRMHFAARVIRRVAQFNSKFSYSTAMAQPTGTINFEEIRAGLENKNLIYVDVRNQSELQSDGKVVGSVNVPLPEIMEAFTSSDADFKNKYGFDKPDKSAPLVVGCFAGKRAAAAGEQLSSLGFNMIKVYPGSLSDWKSNGGAISKE
ncbi:uncharacterized protein LOC130688750 [Daphnia carinata]|uniref:uncharacterized protein LOC130688750 n=1 Tax=Daphnia carinata TaxID=120202 RepID=UPI0028694F09|nr:uncharacterized protein LOC130688750 [Daphnia carinata]